MPKHKGKLDLRKIAVYLGLAGGSEPVISEGEVAIATLKEERPGAAHQNEADVLGGLRTSSKNPKVDTLAKSL